jgi:electron transfer flavoprotein beta subunit
VVLAAALRELTFDLVFSGFDTSDGNAGVVGAAIAARLGLPYLSNAAKIEPDPDAGRVRVRRITASGYDLLEAPMPALVVCTQVLGRGALPRSKGIMSARSKEIASRSWPTSASMARRSAARRPRPGPRSRKPPARGATTVVRGSADEGRRDRHVAAGLARLI